jgi:asparagine synthase (glutamine-hydrolysing)
MSLIYGTINPVKEKIPYTLNQLYEGIKQLPHEKKHSVVKENAGFGHLLTYNTPESLFEQLPVYLAEPNLLFVAQGRIDNRKDLCRTLGIRLHHKLTDGELIQAAYLKWGKNSPSKLKGDWSFAVYDYREQELFLARDQHGYTALYYYFDNTRFSFSSSPKGIFALEGFEKKINIRHLLGDLLLWKMDKPHIQAYENIFIVPPAHTLTFKDGESHLNKYWFPENTPIRNYKNTNNYAEELHEIFKEAVRVRLRSHKPVASMLSGGLDSGSVSAMAAHLLKQEGKQLTTFSHVPLYKDKLQQDTRNKRMLDETPNILATAAFAGNITSVLLDSSEISPTEGFIRAMDALDMHFQAASNAFWLVDLPEQAHKRGFGTLLTGETGNATISYSGLDYLLPWHHPAFLKDPKKLGKRIIKPFIVKHNVSSLLGIKKFDLNNYIKTSYVHSHILKEWRILEEAKGFSTYSPTSKEGMLKILQPGENTRCQFGAGQSNVFGVDLRDPTGDIDVINYCLSIPNSSFFDKTLLNKNILKKMMTNYLPQEVLVSNKRGLQASDIGYRLLSDKIKINELLTYFEQSDAITSIIDINKMKNDWKSIQSIIKGENLPLYKKFTKGLMFGYFLSLPA